MNVAWRITFIFFLMCTNENNPGRNTNSKAYREETDGVVPGPSSSYEIFTPLFIFITNVVNTNDKKHTIDS